MAKAGYDPRLAAKVYSRGTRVCMSSCLQVWERFEELKTQKDTRWDELMSTHPSHSTRISSLSAGHGFANAERAFLEAVAEMDVPPLSAAVLPRAVSSGNRKEALASRRQQSSLVASQCSSLLVGELAVSLQPSADESQENRANKINQEKTRWEQDKLAAVQRFRACSDGGMRVRIKSDKDRCGAGVGLAEVKETKRKEGEIQDKYEKRERHVARVLKLSIEADGSTPEARERRISLMKGALEEAKHARLASDHRLVMMAETELNRAIKQAESQKQVTWQTITTVAVVAAGGVASCASCLIQGKKP